MDFAGHLGRHVDGTGESWEWPVRDLRKLQVDGLSLRAVGKQAGLDRTTVMRRLRALR